MTWRTASIALLLAAFGCSDRQEATTPSGIAHPSLASESSLPQIENTSLPQPVFITAEFSALDCTNHPGPYIYLEGSAVLGELGIEMIFANNMKLTHEYDDTKYVKVVLNPSGETITIPKQPVLGGAGGNPFMWIQFLTTSGKALTGEIYVGRCVQGGSWKISQALTSLAKAWALFAVNGCDNSPGPYIDFTSGLAPAGLKARIIFRNNDNPVGGPHKAQVTTEVGIIPSTLEWFFPKQPVLGGVGGNPWIWAAFTDAYGKEITDPTLLGRCVQLDKA